MFTLLGSEDVHGKDSCEGGTPEECWTHPMFKTPVLDREGGSVVFREEGRNNKEYTGQGEVGGGPV